MYFKSYNLPKIIPNDLEDFLFYYSHKFGNVDKNYKLLNNYEESALLLLKCV